MKAINSCRNLSRIYYSRKIVFKIVKIFFIPLVKFIISQTQYDGMYPDESDLHLNISFVYRNAKAQFLKFSDIIWKLSEINGSISKNYHAALKEKKNSFVIFFMNACLFNYY